ncbi:hypothetical protein [Streptomyces erythrochromogenes]|uniref:hypothetical protein n=1 Tax=Streptomyces erythrochromogenes TaxID=285574 RepID=UPI0036AE5684
MSYVSARLLMPVAVIAAIGSAAIALGLSEARHTTAGDGFGWSSTRQVLAGDGYGWSAPRDGIARL